MECLLQSALATWLLMNVAKADSEDLFIRRLKATAIDVMILTRCSTESPDVQVSDHRLRRDRHNRR